MNSDKCRASVVQAWAWKRAYGSGRDHLGFQGCQNGKNEQDAQESIVRSLIVHSLRGPRGQKLDA